MDKRSSGKEIRSNSINSKYLDLRYQNAPKSRPQSSDHPTASVLGWIHKKIAEIVWLSRNRVSEIVGNTIYGNIDTLLSQGHDMEYIAKHYRMDLALAWSLGLEGVFYHVLSQGNARESKKSKKRPFYEFVNWYLQNILTEH